jgi:thiamine pyrophosphate-dependent acetolactate synthase large subunit-like protein
VLKHNLDIYRQRFGALSNRGYPKMDLVTPDLEFVEMARGMGVAGERIDNPDELGPAVERALASNRPQLIEAVIEGKK